MTTNTKLLALAKPLFPEYGLQKVGDLVSTATAYAKNAGHVQINRKTGSWSWFVSEKSTGIQGSGNIVIGFPADFRRNAAAARALIARALENLRDDAELPVESVNHDRSVIFEMCELLGESDIKGKRYDVRGQDTIALPGLKLKAGDRIVVSPRSKSLMNVLRVSDGAKSSMSVELIKRMVSYMQLVPSPS